MKVRMRKPSVKKAVRAKTTGKIKRKAKKAANPLYGKKGTGALKHPMKSAKAKVYKKTTFSLLSLFKK